MSHKRTIRSVFFSTLRTDPAAARSPCTKYGTHRFHEYWDSKQNFDLLVVGRDAS